VGGPSLERYRASAYLSPEETRASGKKEEEMKYSLSCPPPCSYKINVDAQNDDEGIDKIMEKAKEHAKETHPDMPPMSDAQMKEMVRSNMQKAA
jgi:predicted small metal-binding protein